MRRFLIRMLFAKKDRCLIQFLLRDEALRFDDPSADESGMEYYWEHAMRLADDFDQGDFVHLASRALSLRCAVDDWLVWNHILHVNHWWGFTVRGVHVFWRAGRLNITRDYPHTEN